MNESAENNFIFNGIENDFCRNLNDIAMKTFKRIILCLITNLYCLVFFSQQWKLPFKGKVEKDGGNCSGAQVTLIKNGKSADEKTTGIDGRFQFMLEPDNDYKIEITKAGCIKKFFVCTTRGVPPGDHSNFSIELTAVVLFEPPENCDVSALKKPLLTFAYDYSTKNFEYDKNQYDNSLEALEKIADCEEIAKIITKKFQKLMQDGQKALAKKDCKGAADKFSEALKLRPASEEAIEAKKEAESMCLNGEKSEQDFSDAMNEGNSALASGDYQKALVAFQRAASLKPNEKEPPKKIEEVNALIKKKDRKSTRLNFSH